jgi:hypothetical protein
MCYSLRILIKVGFSLQSFEKSSNIKFYQNPSNASRVTPWGRADTKPIVAFRILQKRLKTDKNGMNFYSSRSKCVTVFYIHIYKVVQIWPEIFVCKQVTVCPGHTWTTLYVADTQSQCFTYRYIYICSRHPVTVFYVYVADTQSQCFMYM